MAWHGRHGASSHQVEGREEVLVVAHEVNLPDSSQCLLLRELGGLGGQTQALAPHAHRPTRHDDHMVPCTGTRW